MTREEKEQTGKYVLQMARLLEDGCHQQEMLVKAVRIIDESLEKEPTTKNDLGVDCIDRGKLIDWINAWGITSIIKNPLIRHIQAISSVTPQEPRWIPVNEKIPNDRDWYLGIFKEPDTGWINPIPFICDYVGRETKATTKEYWILHGFTDMDEHIDYYFNLECVKWMPLPASYEG